MHRIIGELSDGIILLDPNGAISLANDAALAMHGVETLDDMGKTTDAYHERFHLAYRGCRPVPADAYPMVRLCRGETFADIVVDVCRSDRPEPDWAHCQRGLVLHHEGDDSI